jgi:hypothetical protein
LRRAAFGSRLKNRWVGPDRRFRLGTAHGLGGLVDGGLTGLDGVDQAERTTMSRTEAMLRRNDLGYESEMLNAEEEDLRSQIWTLAIEASQLRRQRMEIDAEIASLNVMISYDA